MRNRLLEGTLSQPIIGERVTLNTLIAAGDFPGVIVDIDELTGLCTVKLDQQDEPVNMVRYYEAPPVVVNGGLWQCCYPATAEDAE